MAKYEDFNVQGLPFDDTDAGHVCLEADRPCDYGEDCVDRCPAVDDFLRLTDEMIGTIIDLEDELVRWRQALIKYLSVIVNLSAMVASWLKSWLADPLQLPTKCSCNHLQKYFAIIYKKGLQKTLQSGHSVFQI